MSTPAWQPGISYALGDFVIPRSAAAVSITGITNPGFEAGDSDWTKGTGWAINNAGDAFEGVWRAIKSGSASNSKLVSTTEVDVVPGQRLHVRAMLATSGSSNIVARVGITWRTSGSVDISDVDTGDNVGDTNGNWKPSECDAIVPATAAKAVVFVRANCPVNTDEVLADSFTWNYASVTPLGAFIFEATVAGISGATEPAWPSVAGGTVVDGTVTWTARAASRVTWKAVPILKSGAVEPVWPASPGANVADGSISWRATTRSVEDINCPHTKVVLITTSKVYARSVTGDVVRFSATTRPKDWTTANDAGFLATGMNFTRSVDCTVLNLYRGKLVVMTASGLQLWDVDEDPANNVLVDTIEGIGSIYNRSGQPVAGDYYFLAAEGVRSTGIAAGATNFQAGDIGMPIDPLVIAQMANLTDSDPPVGLHYPGGGQYWLAFPLVAGSSTVFIYTMNRVGQVGAWSRYVFPFRVKYHAQLGNDLYIRDDEVCRIVDRSINYDELPDASRSYFDGIVQWPWLEVAGGQDGMMEAFDIIGSGTPIVQFGYDQRNTGTFTDEYEVDPDTLTGYPIAMPLTAPSISPKITYRGAADNFWELNAFAMYFTN